VLRLSRRRIGPLEIGALQPGEWRFLSRKEIDRLRRAARPAKDRP